MLAVSEAAFHVIDEGPQLRHHLMTAGIVEEHTRRHRCERPQDADEFSRFRGSGGDWLRHLRKPHSFDGGSQHDYKALGIDRAHLEAWIDQAGLDIVLNRAGTTFRKLPDAERENLTREKAIALMLDQPSMIKRPVLEAKGKLLVGFKPEIYAGAFGG